jgi:anti-sigma regulatory factor (Ser/Thr protein kinase)
MEKRFLIARWLPPETQPIPIYDEASVSFVRQLIRETGLRLSLSKDLTESAALIASELTHNQLRHAKQGYFAVRPIERQGVNGFEMIAADIGPGIAAPRQAIQDELPTAASLHAGLAAVCRLADEVEFDNRMSEGLRVIARKFETPAASPCCEIAIMGKPYPGELVSGDDGAFFQSEDGFLVAVADGLGHGPEAREASNQAMETLSRERDTALDYIALALNADLAATRGCAMSFARFDKHDGVIECVSLGDVHSHLYNLRDAHFFTSTPLIVGAGQLPKQRVRIERTQVQPGSVLITFTDGLKSRTSLKGQLDVLRQPAIAIAQHLLEHDSRPDDDALVLVARILR